jgi:hypothetical protein
MEAKKRGRPAKVVDKPVENEIELFRLFTISECPNPLWIRGMAEDRIRVNILLPKESIKKGLIGKWITATKIDGAEENHYKFYA